MRTFAPDVAEKFTALVIRRNGMLDRTPDTYLRQSVEVLRDTETDYILGRVLGLRDIGQIRVRSVWTSQDTTAYLVLYNDVVVEMMTHRAYTRTIRRRWQYAADAPVDGGRDGERFAAAMKHKRPKQVGGGLMRGRLTPRKVRLSIISTHALRRPTEAKS